MYNVLAPTLPSHCLTAFAVNSGPLSDLMCVGCQHELDTLGPETQGDEDLLLRASRTC